MSTSISLQTWALVRRFTITTIRSPISSLFRIILWPFSVIGVFGYIVSSEISSEHSFNDVYSRLINYFAYASTCFHFYYFVTGLVSDRSTGMKSLMLMMGLRRLSYYLANTICIAICILPVVLALAILSVVYVFTETQSSYSMIIFIFVMFVIQTIGLIFVISSFITSSSYNPITIMILVMQLLVPPATKSLLAKFKATKLILFASSALPLQGINILCESYLVCKHCDETIDSQSGVYEPLYILAAVMVFWSLIYYSFAFWFFEVCPWQKDSALKHPLFCLPGKSNVQELAPIIPYRNPLYFESVQNDRPIGIRVINVTKRYKKIPVVDNISFDIYKGETTLLLGHNGAGKTTLMSIILNKLNMDSGCVQIRPSDSGSGKFGVGVCPQSSILDETLNVRQHLELLVDLKTTMPTSARDNHIKRTLDDVSLAIHADQLPSELSGGMKRKLSLAMAFVGDSNVLILDEPSSGLDPDSRVFVWNAIRRYRTDRTVLLSTQHMEEADYLGDRIAIMKEGKIVCCGSSTFLNQVFGTGYKLRIQCRYSRRNAALDFVRKYFSKAELSKNDQVVDTPTGSNSNQDPMQDMVIELTDDKSEDLELRLISLLEDLESSSSHDIISHGLKSSSIEDVLLNTSRAVDESSPLSTAVGIASTSELINRLIHLNQNERQGSQLDLLLALMTKHAITYKRRWISTLVYRIFLPLIGAYSMVDDMTPSNLNDSMSVIFMIFHFIYYPVEERVSKFKTMQLASHASFLVYWSAHFLVDLVTILLSAFFVNVIAVLMFKTYNLSAFVIHSYITLAVVLMGLSAASLAYLLSHLLSNSRRSVGNFFLFFLIGAVNVLIEPIGLLIKKDLKLFSKYLDKVLIAILPNKTAQYLLHGLVSQCYMNERNCEPENELSPIIVGCLALVAQTMIYSGLLYLVESRNLNPSYYLNWRNLKAIIFNSAHENSSNFDVDRDVLNENTKAANLIQPESVKDNVSLVAANLSKSYVRGVKAVDHLYFTVNKGECFGLLGVNGAGKSTTFSMITTELKPDEGSIWLCGNYNSGDLNKYRHNLAYDPQSNPETALNAREAFTMMARLRRIDEGVISLMVDTIIELLEMAEHSLKTASDLSGGTKRKLALGMSLIGNPALLALDEPTAGVDPLARRSIWQLLRALRMQSNSSILISSHAMEECEAICDRISIMARGRLRCIGSFLHLRSKFSRDCNVRITVSGDGDAESKQVVISEFDELLRSKFPRSIEMTDMNFNGATFKVTENNLKRSTLFKALRQFKQKHQNCYYLVNDSSLEDIFLMLARETAEMGLRKNQPASMSTAI